MGSTIALTMPTCSCQSWRPDYSRGRLSDPFCSDASYIDDTLTIWPGTEDSLKQVITKYFKSKIKNI